MLSGPREQNFSAGRNPGGRQNDNRNEGNRNIGGTRTVTTVTETTFPDVLQDVSIVPYIRSQAVKFAADGLRPNRRVYFFFDDVDVTDYIMQANEVTLTQNNDVAIFNAGFSNNDVLVSSANTSQTASLLQSTRFFDFDNATESLRDDAKPRKRRRILRWVDNERSLRFAENENFEGSVTANTGTVAALRVRQVSDLESFFADSSQNTIVLPRHTSSVANNYWGTDGANTVVLIPRKGKRSRSVRAHIAGFDNVTRTLTLSNTALSLGLSNSSIVEINTTSLAFEESSRPGFYTDYEGKIAGLFVIPPAMFRTGDRIFRIIDDPNNDPADCTTRADYRFIAQGLHQVKEDITITTTTTTTLPAEPTRPRRESSGEGPPDPIAQTFFVNEAEYPNGVFISSVGLYFYNKDEVLPVTVQIRPTVNGYPHSYKVLEYAEATLGAEYVTTSDDASIETKIPFEVPIYLEPGEYALVVKSDSLEYEVFVSELGEKIIGTDRIVSEQPYVGSFFKSQNASTWDAIQLEDLTFNLYKCVFNASGSVSFYNQAPEGSLAADAIYTHISDLKLPNTEISYVHSYDSGATTVSYTPDKNFRTDAGRITVGTTTGQYRLTASLGTSDTDISPIIYNKSGIFSPIENYIDNGELSSDDITIVDPGYYQDNISATVPVTITDYRTGTQATATANVNASGNIANIVITSAGSGFINTATATVSGANVANGDVAATLTISSETDPSGGPILAKYISRDVTLAEGFDAGDLRVFLTAYKPSGTDIKVYYKVKAADDPDAFEDKGYTLMNQKTLSTQYSAVNDFNDSIEYEFEPYDTINSISYSTATTTYTTFNQYAFKIALMSNDTTVVPIVYDFRAVALPPMNT